MNYHPGVLFTMGMVVIVFFYYVILGVEFRSEDDTLHKLWNHLDRKRQWYCWFTLAVVAVSSVIIVRDIFFPIE